MSGASGRVQVRVSSPLGPLWVTSDERGLCTVQREDPGLPSGDPHGAAVAFAAYSAGRLDALDGLPVAPRGTDFQRRVWRGLRSIPAGSTVTYGELGARLGLPTGAARAVGAANGANPLLVVLPCHRVIGRGGRLTGYAWGLDAKRTLLHHEGGLPIGT